MRSPWLSVIMPTYNGENYVTSALESIAIQQDKDIEVIVIDDGSTDRTVSIIKAYDDRFCLRIVEGKHTGNWVANTNIGLSMAQGEYISCLHQDDFWVAGRLKTMRPLLAAAPLVLIALHPSWFVDERGHRLGLWSCPLPLAHQPLDSAMVIKHLLVQNFISMPAAIFKREGAIAVGGMDESLWYTADWDLWLKLTSIGETLYISHPLSCFRVHPCSQTAQSGWKTDFRSQLETVLDRHLSAWEGHPPNKQTIVKVARFSVELNVALAAYYHGSKRPSLRKLLIHWFALGPQGWYIFVRDSRIIQRIVARLPMCNASR